MEEKPTLLVAGSGGGTGYQNLEEHIQKGTLNANIVAVLTNNKDAGIVPRALSFNRPWILIDKPYSIEKYQMALKACGAEYFILSGYLKLVRGHDPKKTINIHPGLLPHTKGLYGHDVHQRIYELVQSGEITETAVTMHFVNERYDEGAIIYEKKIPIPLHFTAEDIEELVRAWEKIVQPIVTNLVVNKQITLEDNGTVKISALAQTILQKLTDQKLK